MANPMDMPKETSRSGQMGMSAHETTMSRQMGMSPQGGGHLYMQTNETQNAVVHYRRHTNGAITEVDRTSTGGAGSGVFKPISGEESAPNAFEGADSVILSPDRRFLLATNGGDNSVSSFAVGEDGRLTLVDVQPTGNAVQGRSGTAKALVFAPSTRMLYVLHAFGPDHLRGSSGLAAVQASHSSRSLRMRRIPTVSSSSL
jgi:6-phosphogluconolactonase (cycloisomerase 2 family)